MIVLCLGSPGSLVGDDSQVDNSTMNACTIALYPTWFFNIDVDVDGVNDIITFVIEH